MHALATPTRARHGTLGLDTRRTCLRRPAREGRAQAPRWAGRLPPRRRPAAAAATSGPSQDSAGGARSTTWFWLCVVDKRRVPPVSNSGGKGRRQLQWWLSDLHIHGAAGAVGGVPRNRRGGHGGEAAGAPPRETPYPPTPADHVDPLATRLYVGIPWERILASAAHHSVLTRCVRHCCTSHPCPPHALPTTRTRTASRAPRHRGARRSHRPPRAAAGGIGLASGQAQRRAGPANRRHKRRLTTTRHTGRAKHGTTAMNEAPSQTAAQVCGGSIRWFAFNWVNAVCNCRVT